MPRADREPIAHRELDELPVIAGPAHKPRPRRLSERDPNRSPGTAPANVSRRSSIVLMKCDWPRIRFSSSGFSTCTRCSSILSASLFMRLPDLRRSFHPTGGLGIAQIADPSTGQLPNPSGLTRSAGRSARSAPLPRSPRTNRIRPPRWGRRGAREHACRVRDRHDTRVPLPGDGRPHHSGRRAGRLSRRPVGPGHRSDRCDRRTRHRRGGGGRRRLHVLTRQRWHLPVPQSGGPSPATRAPARAVARGESTSTPRRTPASYRWRRSWTG